MILQSCLVRECRELEIDKEQHLVKCSEKAPLILNVAKNVGWSWLWDLAPELGFEGCVELGPRDQLSRNQLPLNQLPIDQLPTESTPIKSTSHEINCNIIRGILKFYPRGK